MGELVGYARVSSLEQNLDIQVDKLEQEGCTKIYQEKLSGVDSKRPELAKCLDYVREGDTLIITRLDRLARSVLHLNQISQLLQEKKVEFKVIDQHIDTTTSLGRLMFNILGAFAEFENEIRKERQMDGILKAKKRGVQFGGQFKLTLEEVEELKRKRKNGMLIRELMAEYNLSKATVYRYLNSKPNVDVKVL